MSEREGESKIEKERERERERSVVRWEPSCQASMVMSPECRSVESGFISQNVFIQ